MADLNSLLRWSIENSAKPSTSTEANNNNEQLSLKFKPSTGSSTGNSALHPSDPHYRASEDDSPASTPGPETPLSGSTTLPGIPAKRSDLTSEMLDLIMGKPDSAVMKEKMATAVDETQDLDARVEALDDFEMLIESIDNANNMPVLKLWDPLLGLLESSEPEIVSNALWIIGTAVQNNIKAQAALYVFNALPRVLSLIYPTASSSSSSSSSLPPTSVRAKATYALSAGIKHWPLASSALSANDNQGWNVLRRGIADETAVIQRKMAFLVNTIVVQDGEEYTGEIPKEVQDVLEEKAKAAGAESKIGLLQGLKEHGVLAGLVKALSSNGDEDIEFEENAVRALSSAATRGGLSAEEKIVVKAVWTKWGAEGQEQRGLGGEEGKEIERSLV